VVYSGIRNLIKDLNNGWWVAIPAGKVGVTVQVMIRLFQACKSKLGKIDQWLRRRIRMLYWKMWKRVRTRYRRLKRLGVEREQAFEWANSRLGYWRVAGSWILTTTLNNRKLYEKRWRWFSGLYARECVN
jgi:hypothetical protein